MTYQLLTDREAMGLLGWYVREENGGLVGLCCGSQVTSRMPQKPGFENPIELYCNLCGARMVSIWMLRLSPEEKRTALERRRIWVALRPGPQERTVQLRNHTYRMLAQRDHTNGQWHGTLWKDSVKIWVYADQILLGVKDLNRLEQLKQMLCSFAHSDSDETQHGCNQTCAADWRSRP